MNTSVIRYRVADFLKQYAPFDTLNEEDLLALAGNGRVKFSEAGEHLYTQGQPKGAWVWVIQQGRVELVNESDVNDESLGGPQLRDILGEGDVLGLDRLHGDGSYLTSAITATDVVFYAMDAPSFEKLLERNVVLKRFFAAHFSVSATNSSRRSWLDAEAPALEFLRLRVPIAAMIPALEDAARRIHNSPSGVVAVAQQTEPLTGILTATDLCAAVGEGVALAPRSIPRLDSPFTTRPAVLEMVRTHSEALALQQAGATTAVLTASDLALFCDHNPVHLLRQIRQADSAEELAPLLKLAGRMILDALAASSDVDDCALIASQTMSAVCAACTSLARRDALEMGLAEPQVHFSWLAFGALARGEVIRTVPSRIGVVFDDAGLPDAAPARAYFAKVLERLAVWFERCGLELSADAWPAEPEPEPCLPLSEWKKFFGDTIGNPLGTDLFARRGFFDVRGMSLDHTLLDEINREIAAQLKQSDLLILLLANDTLARLPPLTFFHDLILESDGVEHKTLNLNEVVINPIADAARVFALASGKPVVNTLERLAAAANSYPENGAVFESAAEAFRFALYQRAVTGTATLEPSSLSRLDQRVLKTTFTSILRLLELTAATFVTPHES